MMFFQDVLWGALKILLSFMGAFVIVSIVCIFLAVGLGALDVARYKYYHEGRQYTMLPMQRKPSRFMAFCVGMLVLLLTVAISTSVWNL